VVVLALAVGEQVVVYVEKVTDRARSLTRTTEPLSTELRQFWIKGLMPVFGFSFSINLNQICKFTVLRCCSFDTATN